MPAAFESILRSSHLNITKHIKNAMGTQILTQAALWNRLGCSYLASMHCDLFLSKYTNSSPIEDVVKAKCKSASIVRALLLLGRTS